MRTVEHYLPICVCVMDFYASNFSRVVWTCVHEGEGEGGTAARCGTMWQRGGSC